MMKCIAHQNSARAKTYPCLTPDVVANDVERRPARRTLADVAYARRSGMLMRPEYHEAKAEAECEAKAEANIYEAEAEAMRPVTTMHLHSTTKNLCL